MYQLILLKCSNRIILYLKVLLKALQTRQYLNIFNLKNQYVFTIFKTFEGLSKNNKITLLKVKNKTKWDEIK